MPNATGFVVSTLDDAAVVTARGEIDSATAPQFRLALDAAAECGRSVLMVDMAKVGFIDSAGLAVVVRLRRHLPVQQHLVLARVPARMRRMLEVAAVDVLVDVHTEGDPWPWPEVPQPTD
ncbi:MAG TPA: STAS domain-containing protein [Dermatophilaceae bacterium]|nr:STAS domain-containing protein [Dermatophilaceae bacterium]